MSSQVFLGVIKDGKYKVAQFSRFLSVDGIDFGIEVLDRLRYFNGRNVNIADHLDKCQFIAEENITDEMRNVESSLFSDAIGVGVIDAIVKAKDTVLLEDNSSLLDRLFTYQYSYIINYDTGKLQCYMDNKINLFAEYYLSNLPDDDRFVKDVEAFENSSNKKPVWELL